MMLLKILLSGVVTDPVTNQVVKTVAAGPNDESYIIAELIMSLVNHILKFFGMAKDPTMFTILYAVIVFLISYVLGLAFKWAIIGIVRLIGTKYKKDIFKKLIDTKFFIKLCRIIPAIVFLILIQFTLYTRVTLAMVLTRITFIYILYIVCIAINTFITVIWEHFNEKENTKKLPLKGILQLIQGIIWIIAVIIAVSMILGKSPTSLLAGLGAFAAVLMLVFKDSILGVVAGVQLSQNDSLHVGDWIKVKGTDANGTVMEVSLTSVKIMNWDKTVTTVPPYSLITGGFTNYRTMQESNSRQIQRSYMIDADSVVPLDETMLDKFRQIPLIKDWIDKKLEQRSRGIVENVANSEGLADGTIESNLGVFRAYLKLYLDSHPKIDHSGGLSYCFVSTLPQTSAGIPIQIYCFTNTSAWLDYEAIQDSIFEHIAIMLAKFNLYTFENPSGRDTLIDGYLSPGKNPDVIFGMPYPFYNNSGTPGQPCYPVQRSQSVEPSAMTVSASSGNTPDGK